MTEAYPLAWPEGWPQTPMHQQANPGAKFGRGLTLAKARTRLFEELRLLGARNIVLSSNVPLRQDGLPYSDYARRNIGDPGVAVYFTQNKRQLCMAHDRWRSPEANVNALALAVAGLRQMERHGGAQMVEKAFQGFAALPPPGPTLHRPWRTVLRPALDDDPAPWTRDTAEQAYRRLARQRHPDLGGHPEQMAELNAAIAAARRELSA